MEVLGLFELEVGSAKQVEDHERSLEHVALCPYDQPVEWKTEVEGMIAAAAAAVVVEAPDEVVVGIGMLLQVAAKVYLEIPSPE